MNTSFMLLPTVEISFENRFPIIQIIIVDKSKMPEKMRAPNSVPNGVGTGNV